MIVALMSSTAPPTIAAGAAYVAVVATVGAGAATGLSIHANGGLASIHCVASLQCCGLSRHVICGAGVGVGVGVGVATTAATEATWLFGAGVGRYAASGAGRA